MTAPKPNPNRHETKKWYHAYTAEVRQNAILLIVNVFDKSSSDRLFLRDMVTRDLTRRDVTKRYLFSDGSDGVQIEALSYEICRKKYGPLSAHHSVFLLLALNDTRALAYHSLVKEENGYHSFVKEEKEQHRRQLLAQTAKCIVDALLRRGLYYRLDSWNSCNAFINSMESPALAHALLDLPIDTGLDVNARSHDGVYAITMALTSPYASTHLLRRIVERMSDQALNQSKPLLVAIKYSSPSNMRCIPKIRVLLSAAHNDGTGLDVHLCDNDGMRSIENVRRRLQEFQAQLHTDTDRKQMYNLIANEVQETIDRIHRYCNGFCETLKLALSRFCDILPLQSLISEYVLANRVIVEQKKVCMTT